VIFLSWRGSQVESHSCLRAKPRNGSWRSVSWSSPVVLETGRSDIGLEEQPAGLLVDAVIDILENGLSRIQELAVGSWLFVIVGAHFAKYSEETHYLFSIFHS